MAFNNNKGEYIFPFEIKDVDPKVNSELIQDFHGEKTGFVQVGPDRWSFPVKYRDHAERFYNFQARPSDVWITTFPRSGTTWTQELVWLLSNKLNYEAARASLLMQRFPFFELNLCMHPEMKTQLLKENDGFPERQQVVEGFDTPGYESFPQITEPRFIKTHFPFSLLPPSVMDNEAKVIYIARNPKDVVVSWYHLNRSWRTQGFVGNFEKFYDYFERNLTTWSPYWSHIKEGWSQRYQPNVLFMFYEDINKDLSGTIRKIANFLDKPVAESEIPKLLDYLHIKNFKNNQAVNASEMQLAGIIRSDEQGFIRNGKSGVKNEEFTNELLMRCDKWIEENLKGSDIQFP